MGEEVEQFVTAHRLSKTVAQALDLSLTEWVTNIISYGFSDAREHWIDVRLAIAANQVQAEIEDDGREFNPMAHPHVDTGAPLETRPVGGLGIHMMKKLMDSVEYRRHTGRNIVTLAKRLES